MSLVWLNGTLVEKNEARVSPFDHGFLYGDGVWEPVRVRAGIILSLHEHLQRLYQSAALLHLAIPLAESELITAIEATLKANRRTDGYIRLIVTRGPGTIGPDPRKITPQLIVIAEEYHPFPQELYEHGLHAMVYPAAIDSTSPWFRARTLGQPHLALARHHALSNGCFEAILVDHSGQALGTTEGVLFQVKQGGVVASNPQLDVAGALIARQCTELGLTVVERGVAAADLPLAEELFLAGTSCGVIGIVKVDGKDIGRGSEGPLTRSIREACGHQKV